MHPFATTRDYDDWLKRVAEFPAWCDQAIVNMRAGVAAGVVQPRVLMEKVLPQLEAHIVDDPKKSLFHKPVENFPDGVARPDRARLERAFEKRSANRSCRRIAACTRTFATNTCHDAQHRELSALPNGERWYAYWFGGRPPPISRPRGSTTSVSPRSLASGARCRRYCAK